MTRSQIVTAYRSQRKRALSTDSAYTLHRPRSLRTKHQARASIFTEKILQPKLGPYVEIGRHIGSSIDT